MSGGLVAHVRDLARYARSADDRLYDRCAELPGDALRRDTAASLGSILAILEHVLAADRIWLARLRGEPVDTTGLLEPTFRELAPLRRERDAMHDEIERFFAGVDEAFLNGTLRSVDSRGTEHVDPVRIAVAQMFNHQTHHRGQVHALLREHRPEPLALDLHRLLRAEGRSSR